MKLNATVKIKLVCVSCFHTSLCSLHHYNFVSMLVCSFAVGPMEVNSSALFREGGECLLGPGPKKN